jgi:uncharacterized protein (TIGR03492 family)
MVGAGESYRDAAVPVVGVPNLLPSCGFATLSPGLMLRDLRAGWLATYWRQARAARRMRGLYDFGVAVGDVVVIAAARRARLPYVFVGCAKSSYYRLGYTGIEKRLLRTSCLQVFPRDEPTARALSKARVPCRYVGNPMMDDLEPSGETFGIPPGKQVVALLPGSRPDAVGNALDLLKVAETAAARSGGLHFLFAVHRGFDVASLTRDAAGWRTGPPEAGIAAKLRHGGGAEAWVVSDRLADVLHRSMLVIGLAGTANEQAIGLGKPLITFPGRGVQGRAYLRLKMQLLGESALAVPPEPATVAEAALKLLEDAPAQARMIAAGRERMGAPGASGEISREIARRLGQL